MHHGQKGTIEVVGEREVVDDTARSSSDPGFRFGRIFHGLPPFRPTDTSLKALGAEMTRPFTPPGGNISALPAGYTYFGQFIDHDMTKDDTAADPDVAPEVGEVPDNMKQARSPSLDLDSLYGRPKGADPILMQEDGIRFRFGPTTATPGDSPFTGPPSDRVFDRGDVPRSNLPADRGRALIGDPRNDENLIVQQFHLAMLKFHNKVVDALEAADQGLAAGDLFDKARTLTTLHYQWLVLNDFVRRIVDPQTFAAVMGTGDLSGADTVRVNPLVFRISVAQIPPMPLEFSGAAYRLGHSLVRETYAWNMFFKPGTSFEQFFRFTNLSGQIGRSDGLPTFPSNWLADWRQMFELETVAGFPPFTRGTAAGQVPLNLARRLDTHLAPVLGQLPFNGGNLASRNLVRGSRLGLPSGQDIAAAIVRAGDPAAAPMSPADMLKGLPAEAQEVLVRFEFHQKTPLWFYILKEAENAGGERLGPVGSRIVVETFLALIRASMVSIFTASAAQPDDLKVFNPAASAVTMPGGEPIVSIPHLLAFVGDVDMLGDALLPAA
ncbi:MAG: peroxidase family protein [Phreatobacter sp.]|uniref:peroxidase family protein n=1 Tax=Phreatobacter sp. TaxID=1966341 RepID=UPI0040362C65